MTQLKQDLIKLLENDRYYAEQELSRLVYHDTSLKYKDKITAICDVLGDIAFIDTKLLSVNTIFNANNENQTKQQEK